jgi:hypothetical protein
LEDGVLVVEVPKTEPDDVEVKKVEVRYLIPYASNGCTR